MIQTKRADQIAALCEEIIQRTVEAYYKPQAIEEDTIIFILHSELPTEFLEELSKEKWWMKWYDRTFYISNVRNEQFIGIAAIKNTYPKEETEKFLDEFYETMKIDNGEDKTVRSKSGSFENTFKQD